MSFSRASIHPFLAFISRAYNVFSVLANKIHTGAARNHFYWFIFATLFTRRVILRHSLFCLYLDYHWLLDSNLNSEGIQFNYWDEKALEKTGFSPVDRSHFRFWSEPSLLFVWLKLKTKGRAKDGIMGSFSQLASKVMSPVLLLFCLCLDAEKILILF